VDGRDVAALRLWLARYLPDLDGEPVRSDVCLYTNLPDDDFAIDWMPGHPGVLVLSPCSGHGFKFAPAVGEAAADLLTGRSPRVDLSAFRLARWAPH
jgi:sarcosine oxidase